MRPGPPASAFRPSPQTLALAAGCIILFVPLLVPLLLGRIFPLGDLSSFHLPLRFLYQQALTAGDSFLWTSALQSGLYLHAEGQAGMLHPWHLAIYGLLPLGPAFNLEMLGSYLFATAGMWLLLGELGLRRPAAFAGALVFAFSGFNVMHLLHLNLVAVLMHVPWVLFGASILLTTPSAHRAAAAFAGIAALVGSQLLLGFPQGVYLTTVAVAWMAAYRLAGGATLARLAWLGAALGCGLLIGAVQILPMFDAALGSFRATAGLDFRLSFSMHPINLIQLWSPYTLHTGIYTPVRSEWFPHEFGIYNGAVSTLSVLWVAARFRALRHRGLACALLCLAALGIVLALGRWGGLYTLLAHLPGLASFRASTRHIFLVHLAFAGLVALMIDDMLDLQARKVRLDLREYWPVACSPAITIAVVAAGLLAGGSAWAASIGLRLAPAAPALLGAAIAIATAAVMVAGARGWRAAVPVLIVLAALDLAWWGTRYIYSYGPVPIRQLSPVAGLPPGARRQDLVHPDGSGDDANKYPMWGLRSTRSYMGIPQLSVLDREARSTLRVAAVQWQWTPGGWVAVDGTLPRVRLVTDWRVSGEVRTEIEAIDVARTALVEAPPEHTSGEPGSARITRERPGEFLILTDAPGPQLLVVAERFHAGWRATIDGRAIPVQRAYGDFMAARVPAGTHEVALSFSPASTRWGGWITLAGLCAAALGTAVLRRSGARR